MHEVCVVVPGIGGSSLVENNKTIWDVSDRAFFRALITKGQPFEQLTLNAFRIDENIVPKRLIHGAMIIPDLELWRLSAT